MRPGVRAQKRPVSDLTWTLVQTVQQGGEKEAALALEELCKAYRYPIYALLRRSGHGDHDAEDLTQAFFQELICDETLLAARQSPWPRARHLSLIRVVVRLHSPRDDLRADAGRVAGVDQPHANGALQAERADFRKLFSHGRQP